MALSSPFLKPGIKGLASRIYRIPHQSKGVEEKGQKNAIENSKFVP